MPLVLKLKTTSSIPIEVEMIQPVVVSQQSLDEIRRTPIYWGNQTPALAEVFDVSGSAADDSEIVFEGDCSPVKLIGSGLSAGRIVVRGNAGMHLGAEMTGGEIIVHGNVSDWAGAEMHGGRIQIHGHAGNQIGAVYRGGKKGMTGGEILIHGNAGHEIGNSMRRGLIAIGGHAGDAVGYRLIAGTILIFGQCGIRPGAGMLRGTIGILGTSPPPALLPTFRSSGYCETVFLQIYLRHLLKSGFPIPDDCLTAEFHRHRGDFLELGRGEILLRAS